MLRSVRASLIVLGLAAAVIWAPRAAAAEDANTEAAKIHFKAGEQYYVRGLYSQAIAEFNEAYRLSNAPALLYNISQAYERLGDLPAARDHLKRYMDSGGTEPGEMPALQQKLDNLDRRIAEAKAAAAPPPPPPTPVVEQAPARPLRTWKWVLGGVGVGAAAVAILFGIDGNKQETALQNWIASHPPLQPFNGEALDIYNRGKRDNTWATVFGVGGAALIATSVVFFIFDATHGPERPAATALVPVIGPGFTGAAATVRF